MLENTLLTKKAIKKKKERKHALNQESDQEKENTVSTKKVRFQRNENDEEKEGSKWRRQIRIKHSAPFFR